MANFRLIDGVVVSDNLIPGSIQDSIEKWGFVVDNIYDVVSDGGIQSCALCQMYYAMLCKGCPVSKFTGRAVCSSTPIDEWNALMLSNKTVDSEDLLSNMRKIAERERDFLAGLVEV